MLHTYTKTHKNRTTMARRSAASSHHWPPLTLINPLTRRSARGHYPTIRSGAIAALGVLLMVPNHPQHHTTSRNPRMILILTVLVLGDGSSYRKPAAPVDWGWELARADSSRLGMRLDIDIDDVRPGETKLQIWYISFQFHRLSSVEWTWIQFDTWLIFRQVSSESTR